MNNWLFKYFGNICEVYTFSKYLVTSVYISRFILNFTIVVSHYNFDRKFYLIYYKTSLCYKKKFISTANFWLAICQIAIKLMISIIVIQLFIIIRPSFKRVLIERKYLAFYTNYKLELIHSTLLISRRWKDTGASPLEFLGKSLILYDLTRL